MFDFAAHGLIASSHKLPLPGDGPQTIGAILDAQLARDGSRLALVGRSGRFTYAQLDARADCFADVFRQRGLGKYERIAVCLPNDVDIVIALIACARLGAIWVGVNRPLAPLEKAYLLQDSAACLYLTDAQGSSEIAPQLDNGLSKLEVLEVNELREVCDKHETGQRIAVEVDAFEPAAIAYTSGTTGRPRGAVHSHHNVLLPGAIQAFENNFGPNCHQGVMLPLTILNLMVLAPMTAFQTGSACVCMDSLKPRDIARWVRQEKVGHFASVPTVIQDLLTAPEVDPDDLVTLGRPDIGGAGIAQSFQQLYRERFGRCMTVAYGMTEAPTIVSKTDPDREPEEELCGRAVAQVEIVVVDDNDQPLPAGEVGEICIRPARAGAYANVYTPMLGYWNRAQESFDALRNGMYHTGDLGLLHANGELYIRGRSKELIIRGGANIYPAEVERVLVQHPTVKDAAVLGVDDARLGQRVVAVIECADRNDREESALAQELRDWCAARIARYKIPAQIRVLDSLPRNTMNKIVKPRLAALFD